MPRLLSGFRTRLALLGSFLWMVMALSSIPQPASAQDASSAAARSDRNASIQPAADFAPVAEHLRQVIESEIKDKGIPSFAIAITDGERMIWAQAFGTADAEGQVPATAETIYRVGSVSKLFTDVAVMRLVEQGKLKLDAPVSEYIPEFHPHSRFEEPITLRELMSHRAGLVREPPVGHYFDPAEPTLAATVLSLNDTSLVLRPGEKTKYSNAGIAVVGYVLERTQEQPFVDYLREELLLPLGMDSSRFEAKADIPARRAHALMWGYDGREFAAPTFELGTSPAGSMYTTVLDLSKFSLALLEPGKILKAESLAEMWRPQFAAENATEGYGLGFHVSRLDGHKIVRHGGAIYGFSTEWTLMPEEKIGIVGVAAKDVTNSLVTKIVNHAHRCVLAQRAGERLPEWPQLQPVGAERARDLAGSYKPANRGASIELLKRGEELYAWREPLYYRLRVAAGQPDALLADDAAIVEGSINVRGDGLQFGGVRYSKQPARVPKDVSASWRGLIGEYGWDHDVLFILEREGTLHALIEWIYDYPLEQIDENTFRFPNYGLYHDEHLVFARNADGQATQVTAAEVVFKRRNVGTPAGETFKITPLHPADELRTMALAATPPQETPPAGGFRQPDLVELQSLDETIKYDIRYASDNNFMGTPFYQEPHAFMQRPAAEALVRAHQKLKSQGLGLLIHDAYRPWYVTKMFWEATPDAMRTFVADPSKGSRHNRGCAVDVTLYDLATGEPIETVSGYDEFTERAFPEYPGGTSRQRYYRELLRDTIEAEGFTVYEHEWWHFDFCDWTQYGIMNDTFENIPDGAKQ